MTKCPQSSELTPHPSISEGDWVYTETYKCCGKVIEKTSLWTTETFRVWLPSTDTVVRLSPNQISTQSLVLSPQSSVLSTHYLTYVASAARVADTLTQDVLLAPIESSVIPLPHQIKALSRAVSGERVRYVLADEVGLGKTIEAGLILRELKLRGLVNRVLVVAPKGLVTQWIAEMQNHFNEDFRLLIPGDFSAYRRIVKNSNIWQSHPQVVCPMDSVKQLESRRGWSATQIAEYNKERFEDLISAGWDLVVVDEAHRLGGSTDQVARYKLGQGLAECAPYLLLLSATPHQGKTDNFHRLISLIDAQAFPDVDSVTRERVQPHVIRTEKRRAIAADGKPLFKPRKTELAAVSWGEKHKEQHLLYDAVTEYVRQGYNKAVREKRSYIGFLMILMQRLVVSSTRAIRTTLQRRLEVLQNPQQLSLLPVFSEEELIELDGQEQVETLMNSCRNAFKNERAEVKVLLETAARCEDAGADAKAEMLLERLYRLQAEEGDPELKVLVFTEFVPTQQMLQQFLLERGFSVTCLNGSMNMDERKKAQDVFAREARILISTDAGGEGLNLQFCHVVINYDIPWNPMRLEQRIGRVDRIGQTHTVRAVNFVFEDSVEHRVREVLENKLAVIFEQFGIDKTGDVLDSAQAEHMFDDLYVEAIMNPDELDHHVDKVVAQIQEQARNTQESSSLLGAEEHIEPSEAQRLTAHPLPHWVENMTVHYLHSHGGKAEHKNQTWNLTWPDGDEYTGVVFSSKDAERTPAARILTLENSRIRGLAMRLPRFAPGQPVPVASIPGISNEISGYWSLWRICVAADDWNRYRIMPLFMTEDEKMFAPTARHVWDHLLSTAPHVLSYFDADRSQDIYDKLAQKAEKHGKTIYDELVQEHRTRLAWEKEKGEYAFAARRKVIERVGLPQVRDHRLHKLQQEQEAWKTELSRKRRMYPEMEPLLIMKVMNNGE